MVKLPNWLKPLHGWLQSKVGWIGPRLDAQLNKLLGIASHTDYPDDSDYISSADWAIVEQNPRRARLLVWGVLVLLLVLILWAAMADLDEVTRGEGKVVPSRQIQQVQSLDGGIVETILVHEGQLVEANQLLLKIDQTRYQSSFKENRAGYLALKAKVARLEAIAEKKPFVIPDEVRQEAPDIAVQEQLHYQNTLTELTAKVAVAQQQLVQRNQELAEIGHRRTQAARTYELSARELEVTKPLASSGAVSDVELLRLERDVTRSRGERDSAGAESGKIQAAIAEARRHIEEIEVSFRNNARTELADAMAKLGGVSESSVGLQDRVKRAEVRSPVKGTIKTLYANTVGGVIQPGKNIVEVVPLDDNLLVEARIQPKDVAFLRPGLNAMVKFTAYDFATYGGLEGRLEHISADTITDEKGNAFYIVRVRTRRNQLGDRNKPLPIIPGMVAEVNILTGQKSILSYLLKPVLRAKAEALTER